MKMGWIVDPCRDANGHWTIREADGTSSSGNLHKQPIATVYSYDDAVSIVCQHNQKNNERNMGILCQDEDEE